jgi:hypothetical protein
MEIHQFKSLLDQVNAITAKYRKINDLTGENFNVFRILKLESSEVRMHSAFIAELLNPHGSHGQRDVFLKLFVKSFCFKENLIDTESCRISIEENIGRINEDRTQGGRIDIVITDIHSHQIIIENKIYANDQTKQLTRYYNYSNNADIIYLTLDGKDAAKDSKGELEDGIHYKRYSYKHDILDWLELCRKEVAIYPIVREAITHYINLIKYLTNQTLNKTMQDELSDLIKLNLEASFSIVDNLDKACDKISKEFGLMLKDECNKKGLVCKFNLDFDEKYNGIWIWKEEWKYVNIGFQFQNYDKDLIYGIVTKKHPKDSPIPLEVRNNINVLPSNTPKINDWWPWFKRMEEPYNNWSKFQAWQAILNGKMRDVMIQKIDNLLKLIVGLEI